jgi:hypothetical protein
VIDGRGDNALREMQQYVALFQSQNQQGSLKKLLADFTEEMQTHRLREMNGSPSRSEESWESFAGVGEVVADWIGSAASLNAGEANTMRAMFAELKTFDARFPDHVPPYVLLMLVVGMQDCKPVFASRSDCTRGT